MRRVGTTFALIVGLSWWVVSAAAQDPSTTGSPSGAQDGPRASLPSAQRPLRESYAAIPYGERISIQADLVWAGLYNGPVDGEFSDPFVNAVRAFQRQNKTRQTGVLNPAERAALSDLVRPLQEQVGWRMVHDTVTGARVGLPMKLVPKAGPGKTGSLWSSAQGQVRIETFRIVMSEANLAAVFEQLKKEPERKVEHEALKADSFTLIGMQGLKKMQVRAFARNGEIRGITILYDQAVDGTLDPLMLPMASAFQPFATPVKSAQEPAAPRRNVEYGTGIVVSSVGHIVTDRQVIEGCHTVIIPAIGRAERVAENAETNLALLRVYGAEDLVPLALLSEPTKSTDVTLLGIADPQAQAGNAAISTATTRLVRTASTAGTLTTLAQTPVSGFSGAAVLDKSGRFLGMVELKLPVVAGPAAAAPKATIVPAEAIRNFIEANYVAPTSGEAGLEQAKASVVRVICVRK
jgi:peptidoglycan hydrolase-like protein with peptidoglycan-binding domain